MPFFAVRKKAKPAPQMIGADATVQYTKGLRRWFRPAECNAQAQRGFPMPMGFGETRAAAGEAWPLMGGNGYAQPSELAAPDYGRSDMGAAGVVNSFGKVLTNPIGAGVVANNRPQASYGMAAQYLDNTIFWAPQTIPTTIPLNGLTSPQVMAALLGTVNVQAAVRSA